MGIVYDGVVLEACMSGRRIRAHRDCVWWISHVQVSQDFTLPVGHRADSVVCGVCGGRIELKPARDARVTSTS